MGALKGAMKLIPIFLILLFFTGVLLIVYISITTFSRRMETSLFGRESNGEGVVTCNDCDIPFNLRKLSPQVIGSGGGDETRSKLEGFSSVDEVALYGEDFLRVAERLKMKVVSNLRRYVLNGAKVVGHLNHYGVNFTQLRPRAKPSRDKIMCRIKAINFDLLNKKTSSVFSEKSFPAQPLFSDFIFAKDNGSPLMEKELQVSDDIAAGSGTGDEPLYRTCAVVPNSAALDGSQHGLDIDSHDFILRFNDAPTRGFEEDVGSLTSMRIINSQVFTKPQFQFPISSYQDQSNINFTNENSSNTQKSSDLDALWSSTRKYLIWDPCNFSASVEQWYKQPDHPLFEKYFELTSNFKKYGHDKFYILNCRILWKLWKLLYENTFAKIYGNPPTSGFLGIILAMQKCERVNVYEYIPSSRESARCHYYGPKNESNQACTYGSWHPVSAEKLFFLNLSDGSDKEIYMDGRLSLPGVSKTRCPE